MAEFKEKMEGYPSSTLGSGGDLVSTLDKQKHKTFLEMQCCTPAQVMKYDRDSHIAYVQPLANRKDANGNHLVRSLMKVTVWRPYCGKYLIDIPIDVGDVGWVIAADQNTFDIKQYNPNINGEYAGTQTPNTDELHMYHFGFFIPDRWGDYYNTDAEHNAQLSGSSEDASRLVIQSADGNQKISMQHFDDSDKGEIKITSIDTSDTGKKTTIVIKNGVITVDTSTETNVSSPKINVLSESVDVTAAKSIAVHCPQVTYDGNTNFTINGILTVTGNITSTGGEITEKTGIMLGVHTHKYNPGSGAPTETVPPTVP